MADNNGVEATVSAAALNHSTAGKSDDMATPKSKRTTSPAFQFYPESWFSSSKVSRMSHAERGMYIDLLARCWLDNGLPKDERQLASLMKMPASRFRRIWSGVLHECFIERGGKLVNPRQERERNKQSEFRRRQADNGSKGGRPSRNPTETQTKPNPNPDVSERVSLSKPRAIETEIETETRNDLQDQKKERAVQFQADRALRELQAQYPPSRVTSGYRTEAAFIEELDKNPPSHTAFRQMLANLENHKRSHEWRVKGMIPGLEKWLRDGLWLRLMPEEAPVAERVSKNTSKTLSAVAEIMGEDE